MEIKNIKEFDKESINKFIDSYGIPFRKMSSFGINLNDEMKLKKDKFPKQFIKIDLPFKIDDESKNQMVIDYIYDLTNIKVNDVNDLLSMRALFNKPFLLVLNEHSSSPSLYIAFKRIPGSVIIRGDNYMKDNGNEIKTLGNIEYINGDLGLSNTELEDLGNLKIITGDFWMSATDDFISQNKFKITSLNPLEKVNGSVTIIGNSITSLGSINYVGNNLNLRKSNVIDLGNLEFVGGNLIVSKNNIKYYDFTKVKVVGKIRSYFDKL